MAKRICLLTGNDTTCRDGCYNCDCGGEVALNDCYVPIYNVQRVCDIVKNMDIDLDSAETAEYIRNELERMVVALTKVAGVQPVKHGKWIDCTFYDPYEKSYEQNYEFKCSNCGHKIYNKPNDDDNLFCGHCSAKMTLREPEAIKKPDIQLLRDAVDLIKKAKGNNDEPIKG